MSPAPPPGVYVPAVVFYTENDELDQKAIQAHVLRLAKGVTGILVQGSNGEAQHLSHEERAQAIRITRQTLDENGYKHVLVIAGTGTQSTKETIQLCIEAKEAGASHALVLTPSTWVPMMTKENVLRFHREVADSSPIPTMVYNFPVVTAGQNLDSDLIGELAKHPNIVGTKLSCGDIGKLHRLTSAYSSEEFAVYAGKSEVFVQGLISNSAGIIGALVNLLPKLHKRGFELFQKGDLSGAMQLQSKLGRADWAVQRGGGIGAIKTAILKQYGYGNTRVRGPLASAEIKVETELLAELFKLEDEL